MSRGSARAELHHSEAHHPLRFDCEHGCVARQLNPVPEQCFSPWLGYAMRQVRARSIEGEACQFLCCGEGTRLGRRLRATQRQVEGFMS